MQLIYFWLFKYPVLFATDILKINSSEIPGRTAAYAHSFQILETDGLVNVGPSSLNGLNLPKEALENIYYKNALKIYPCLPERMRSLGYKI